MEALEGNTVVLGQAEQNIKVSSKSRRLRIFYILLGVGIILLAAGLTLMLL
jgi:hypothetical protein